MKKIKLTIAAFALTALVFAPVAANAAGSYTPYSKITSTQIWGKTVNNTCPNGVGVKAIQGGYQVIQSDTGYYYAEVATPYNATMRGSTSHYGY